MCHAIQKPLTEAPYRPETLFECVSRDTEAPYRSPLHKPLTAPIPSSDSSMFFSGCTSDVTFTLRPTPRIVIESIQDLSFLIDNGLISSDNAYDLSNMLLGVDLKQGAGKDATSGQGKQFESPNNILQTKVADVSMKSQEVSMQKAKSDAKRAKTG